MTHIQTLASNTPRSRRRVRKVLQLDPTATVTSAHVFTAMIRAAEKERNHNPKKK